MKLKGLTKLALSGVALAAVAATLGTSTYAWYVTNSTASVGNINGTAQAGGTGSVLVAEKLATGGKNGHGAWQKNIASLNTGNYTSTTTAAGLVPATPVSAVSNANTSTLTSTPATLLDGDTKWVKANGAELTSADKAFIEFDVWVLSTDATKVKFSFGLENTTPSASINKQIAYNGTSLPTGVSQGDSFAVNIVDALRVAYTRYDFDSTAATASSALPGTKADASVFYDAAKATSSSTVATGASFATANSGDAHAYYHAVLGANDKILETGPSINGTTAQELNVTKNVEFKLHFYVWLEGTDAQCFDSCNGQSFKLDLKFEAVTQAQQNQTPTQP